MPKTIFHIKKMDCPSEEQMIRLKLQPVTSVQAMEFDIPQRTLTVFHEGSFEPVFQALDALQFDTSVQSTIEHEHYNENTESHNSQRKLLWQVLLINAFFFVLEMITGVIAGSMGLIADSLDMLADTFVYALALWAVGATIQRQKNIALSAGILQSTLAVLGIVEVIRRFIEQESMPDFLSMMIISALALIGNGWCLYLLQKSRSKEAHMQASMIFTSNDVLVNIGVIVSGALVVLTASPLPDLVVGAVIFLLVARGAWSIFQLVKK